MNESSNSLIQIPQSGYRGQTMESASGLYFLGNGVRAYSTKLRQFYSRDPNTPFKSGNINRYQYAELDPVNLWDITGFNAGVIFEENNSNIKPSKSSYSENLDFASSIVPHLLLFLLLLVSVIIVVATGGAALPAIINVTGLILCAIGGILRLAMLSMEADSLEYKILETIAITLEIIGGIVSMCGALIGAVATRSGTLAARMCQRFATHTRIGRVISRRTLAYTRVQTSTVTNSASMRNFLGTGSESFQLTTSRSLPNLSHISSIERTLVTNSSRYSSVASSLNSEYFDALSSLSFRI